MNTQLCYIHGHFLCYRYHVYYLLSLFSHNRPISTNHLDWIIILDIVNNIIEASLGRVNCFLWTNLVEIKSSISNVVLDALENQMFNSWTFG